MSKKLLIVESPAKTKTISKYLGKDYVIKASFGHVRDLPPRKLAVNVEENFEPTYQVMSDKKKVIKELKDAAKKADEIYLATDPDREGEAIAWHVLNALDNKDKVVKRIVFNEITEGAILEALESSRQIDMKLVDAQQARRVLDRLIGYKLSPILSKKIRRGLSAGRVQSVAVRILCEREREIQAFVPEEYWVIDGQFKSESKDKIQAKLFASPTVKDDIHLAKQADSDAALKILKDAKFSVSDVLKKQVKRYPYLPFITSTLQQDSSRKLNWSAKKTMMVAQQLYEGVEVGGEATGLITYMRTDSTRVSDTAVAQGKDYILKEFGPDYVMSHPRPSKQKKGTQDAHEAIRPTYIDKTPQALESNLTADQFKLYKLIWDRFIASQMRHADVENTSIIIASESDPAYFFKVTGHVIIFDGFLKVYQESKDDDEKGDDSSNRRLPAVKQGDALTLLDIEGTQKFTQPPHRYTEARLVKEMEEKGIGRPSTYAPTISTILDRGYVDKEKKTLIPSELGLTVNDQLLKFFDDFIDVDFTADMETKLDRIIEGEHPWQDVVGLVYTPFESKLEDAKENMENLKVDKPSDEICETCGKSMVIKAGRFGDFLACSDFPNCKTTKSIVVELDVKCPDCESAIVEKRSRRGKVFYGCSGYPKCTYALWDKPVAETCPKCSGGIMVTKNDKMLCPKCDIKPRPSKFKKKTKDKKAS